MDASAKATRRGSRRTVPAPPLEGPSGGPGLAHRVLAFESYVGFQHDYIGILAGLIVALGLLARWSLRTSRLRPRR
jgi:hypothetical protein